MINTDYCRDKAAPEGSGFYYAVLFEPLADKTPLYALIALQQEILQCLTATPDPGVTQMKLQWWCEETARLFQGQPRHPVTRQLLTLVDAGILQHRALQMYLQTLYSICNPGNAVNDDDWLETIVPGLGQIWCVTAGLYGPVDEQLRAPLVRNGGLVSLLELMQNINVLTSKGYNFLPGNTLLSVTPDTGQEDIEAACADSIDQITDGLEECYRHAMINCRKYPLFQLIMNRIATVTCIEILKDGCRLQKHRISLTPLRKLWIACRVRMTVKLKTVFSGKAA